ncbi:hypothetical protein FJ364_04470 [Candidatus Dependentiae bacterium]|nr:hypothetical protein [Candidatus Dependentiae bacterium]
MMNLHTNAPHSLPFLHCDYDHAYESIYDSSYGSNFVFYDEDELVPDDGYDIMQISDGTMVPPGSSQR